MDRLRKEGRAIIELPQRAMGFGDKSKKEKQAEASAAASVFSSLQRSIVQDRRIAILVKTPALVHCCQRIGESSSRTFGPRKPIKM